MGIQSSLKKCRTVSLQPTGSIAKLTLRPGLPKMGLVYHMPDACMPVRVVCGYQLPPEVSREFREVACLWGFGNPNPYLFFTLKERGASFST